MAIWISFFLCFAIISLLCAIFFFLKKKGDAFSNRLLGIYLLLFCYNLTYNSIYWSGNLFTTKYINIMFTLYFVWAAYAPLVYIYIRRIVTKKGLRKLDLVHLIPILIILADNYSFFILDPQEKLLHLQNGTLRKFYLFGPQLHWMIMSLMFLYLILIYYLFIKSDNRLHKDEKLVVKLISTSFLGYVICLVFYFILREVGLINVTMDYFIVFFIILFVSLMSYLILLQPEVFNGRPIQTIVPFVKYRKTTLSEKLSIAYRQRVLDLMATEKPYFDSELRLDDLANQLNISRHHTSQVINQYFGVSFFDLINKYRIEEAENLLNNPNYSHLTVTDIAYRSGFNNRATFYKAFKKHIGRTPTEYKRQNKAS